MNKIYEEIISNLNTNIIYNTHKQTINNFTCNIDSYKLYDLVDFKITQNSNSLPQYNKFIRAHSNPVYTLDSGEEGFKLEFNPFKTIKITESTQLHFGLTFRAKNIHSSGGIHLAVTKSGKTNYTRPIYKVNNRINVFYKTVYELTSSDYSDLSLPNKGWIDIDVFYTPTLTKVYKDGVLINTFDIDLLEGVSSINNFRPYHCSANVNYEMIMDFTRSTLIDFTDIFYYTQNFNNELDELTTLVIPFINTANTIIQTDTLDINKTEGTFNDLELHEVILNPYERQYLIKQNIENNKLNRHFYVYDLINLKPFI